LDNAAQDTGGEDMRVKLPVFEGPLDLLLYLIKQNEVDIYDIEIAKITDQYLAYLEAMEEMNVEVAGEFLVIAATLVYIKSRTLLPKDQQAPEEEIDEEDPRWELVRQLIEYKKFKDAAFELGDMEREQERIFYRTAKPERAPVTEPQDLGKVSVFDLVQAFQRVLQRASEREGFREIFEDKFTVSEKIELILDRIDKEENIRFSNLFSDMSSRAEIVVTFLALLELIRLKQLRAVQNQAFDEIEIVKG
jgi:segregation and condensation protein A